MNEINLVSIFGKFMDYFKGFDFETFITLQPEHIKEAIPDLVQRIKFENVFKRFILSLEENKTLEEPSVVDITYNINETEVSNFNSCDKPVFDDAAFAITSTAQASTSKTILISNIEKTINVQTVQDIIDIPNIELKIVITKVVSESKPISDYDRVVIGKSIIHQLLVNDFERIIRRDEFIGLATIITQLFPKELLGTYYIPAVNNHQAQGKLYSAYQNYKTQLRESGIIRKRAKALNQTNIDPVQLKEKSEAFKLLLEESNNFDHVEDCWQFCYTERQSLLKDFSIFEYVRKFPAFDLPNGYELLTLDATRLLGTKSSKLLDISPKIILYASRKKQKAVETKNVLVAFKELSENLDENNLETLKQLTAIKLLPHLMPHVKRKHSKSEVGNLFCPHFKTATEADTHNVYFREKYKETSLVLKPRLYFVGDLVTPHAVIHIADKNYSIENGLKGFDTLFKCFLGLNCKYPEETEHLWQFVQTEIYDIQSGSDKQSASLLTFTQDIKNIVAD